MENFEGDLTAEERSILGSLKDPDAGGTNQYKWEEDTQREIVSLLLHDKNFVIQSAGLIRPSYFTNECHQALAKLVFDYFEKYKGLPTKIQMTQELRDQFASKNDKIKALHFGEFTTVLDYYVPGLESREYYLDRITNFAKGMAMRYAFSKSLEEYKAAPNDDATFDKIEKLVRDALSVDRNFDIGMDYFQTVEERYERMKEKIEKGEFFITGFKSIDDAFSGGGLGRGEMGSVMALSGGGKSIFLVNAAIANMHRDKKVLYVSLEIDQDKCAERFDAQFANPMPFGDQNSGVSIKNLYEKKEQVFESLRSYVRDKDDQRLMVVRQFPAGTLDMAGFRAYYAQLKLNGFVPDLVVIDYIGEMKDYPNMPTWESRQRLVRDLRGFAVQEQVAVLTAMQPDGKAREQVSLGGVIDDTHLAESKGQVRPLDALWSINQLGDEKECGLARFYVIKHRDGKSRFTVHIQFDYDTLRMREISESTYNKIYMKYRNEKTVDTNEQLKKDAQSKKLDKLFSSEKTASVLNFKADVGYNDVEDGIEQ